MGGTDKIGQAVFTFHYVSIKSLMTLVKAIPKIDLHSTMYLLNLSTQPHAQ